MLCCLAHYPQDFLHAHASFNARVLSVVLSWSRNIHNVWLAMSPYIIVHTLTSFVVAPPTRASLALHYFTIDMGIDDPHVFINVCYSLFCCNTRVRGDRRSPRIYHYTLFLISLQYTTMWGSSIPTYLSMHSILYFVAVHEYVGIFLSVHFILWFRRNTRQRGELVHIY